MESGSGRLRPPTSKDTGGGRHGSARWVHFAGSVAVPPALARAVQQNEARLIELSPPAQGGPGSSDPPPSVCVVALDDEERARRALARLQPLAVPALAIAAGADGWSIPQRAKWLILGVESVLDSTAAGFEDHCAARLRELLARIEAERSRLEAIQGLMRGLGIVGDSAPILEVFARILRACELSDVACLIRGETGTGKELVARALHRLDPKRALGPFVAVNCAALPASLAESELFGHKEGSFTGARRSRTGLVRSAEGGVLFLDEVGELPGALQSKLLRLVEDRSVTSLGEDTSRAVDVRIIAATNRDLESMIAGGDFREDLYHRLAVLEMRVPPLRERKDDLRALVDHFLDTGPGPSPQRVGKDFLQALRALTFPGNIRQLRNLVVAASLSAGEQRTLQLAHLPRAALQELAAGAGTHRSAHPSATRPSREEVLETLFESEGWDLTRCLDRCEQTLLRAALVRSHWNQTRTAKLLGVTPRTVYTKLRKHGLHR